jgi:hypothetical protein
MPQGCEWQNWLMADVNYFLCPMVGIVENITYPLSWQNMGMIERYGISCYCSDDNQKIHQAQQHVMSGIFMIPYTLQETKDQNPRSIKTMWSHFTRSPLISPLVRQEVKRNIRWSMVRYLSLQIISSPGVERPYVGLSWSCFFKDAMKCFGLVYD